MAQILKFVAVLLTWLRSTEARREAEILYLRQQLIVLKRSSPARPRLKGIDRLIFVFLYRLFPSLLHSSIIFKPETLLRWHRIGFRLFWRRKSRRPAGRPAVSADIRNLIRRITEAFPWEQAPCYLIRDRDSSYGAIVRSRIRAMGIRDRPIAPRSPWQNGHVERLIGSIRRECLDHVLILSEAHLRSVLAAYATYYNELRTHRSLAKDTPLHRAVERLGAVTSRPILGGLHHQYCRI